MGIVIKFPDERVVTGDRAGSGAGATIIILPVIRIERGSAEPTGGLEPTSSAPGGKRRRRPR